MDTLQNRVYKKITGYFLIKSFNFKDFQKVRIESYVWQPYENWSEEQLKNHISDIADAVITFVQNAKG